MTSKLGFSVFFENRHNTSASPILTNNFGEKVRLILQYIWWFYISCSPDAWPVALLAGLWSWCWKLESRRRRFRVWGQSGGGVRTWGVGVCFKFGNSLDLNIIEMMNKNLLESSVVAVPNANLIYWQETDSRRSLEQTLWSPQDRRTGSVNFCLVW